MGFHHPSFYFRFLVDLSVNKELTRFELFFICLLFSFQGTFLQKAAAITRLTFGGPDGIRTRDLRDANAALYQLSYRPAKRAIRPAKWDPPTKLLGPMCEILFNCLSVKSIQSSLLRYYARFLRS